MLFEIGSTLIMGGVAGYAFYKQKGLVSSDADKIQKIFNNAGLKISEGKETKTIRLLRRRKIEGGQEYVYQLPLGLSFNQIVDKKNVLEDGLNVRSETFTFRLSDLKKLKFDKTIIRQIKKMIRPVVSKKEIELEFDGCLKLKVYDSPLSTNIKWSDDYFGKGWKVPVGLNRQGIVYHNFDSDYFLIVAGTSGFGKSQIIKLIITTLTLQQPKNVHFHLIDLKGGLSFGRFRDMRQVKSFGVDQASALEILKNVQSGMNSHHEYLLESGYEDVKEAGLTDRHFVIIDEAADLTDECQDIVEDIARRGRACGLRMIYATQYPTNETLRSQVRQNALARICFKLKTNIASRAVLDQGGAEELPKIPGRAIYQTTDNMIIQTPYMSNKQISERIAPHIIIKGRKEDDSKKTEGRRYTFEFEEL